MCQFRDINGRPITYDQVMTAMKGQPFPMSLTAPSEIQVIMAAVNQGIDAHLEACFVPARGDSFEPGVRKTVSGIVHTKTLECTVSVESMPVLLRRLFSLPDEKFLLAESAELLAQDILTLIFEE